MKLLLSLHFLVCFTWSIQGQTTYYISETGDDSNTGLVATDAFETINHAINLTSCGDSIYVLSGTYHEKVNAFKVCPENDRIVIQGDVNNGRPKIIGDSTVLNKYAIGATGAGFRIRHFELTSPYPNDCLQSNMVVVGSGDYFDFIDVIVHHSGYDGIKTTSDCATNDFPIGWRIIDSEIHSNGLGCPVSVLNGDGIDFTECRNCLIDNSIIRDNMGHQLQIKLEARNVTVQDSRIEGINMIQIGLKGGTPQCDMNALNADSIYFRRNIIFAKGDTSEFIFKLSDVSNLVIENNTIIKDSIAFANVGFICFGGCGSSASWQFPPQSPVVIRNNIFANMSATPFFAGPDTSYFDPLGIVATQVSDDYNLFYDAQGSFITPVDGGANSIVSDPLFCGYPINLALLDGSPGENAGDPTSPNDPDGTQSDIGAVWHQIDCLLGIPEVQQEKFTLFPNPAKDKLILESSENGSFQIVSASGKTIISQTELTDKAIVNVVEFKSGLYFVIVRTESGRQVQKLIKK